MIRDGGAQVLMLPFPPQPTSNHIHTPKPFISCGAVTIKTFKKGEAKNEGLQFCVMMYITEQDFSSRNPETLSPQ